MRFEPTKMPVSHKKPIITYGIMVITLLLFVLSISITANGNIQRQKDYLDSALRRNITYCYATTGSYPDTLETIETKYGLTYDKNKFYVDYKILGKNIYPKFIILEK